MRRSLRNSLRLLLPFLAFALAATSRAQETWSAVTSPTTENLWSVCHGAGQFVACGEGGTILTSPDGITWTRRVSGHTLWLVGAAHGNGLFVVVGDQGTILTSPDGVAWTGRTSGTTARINGIAYGNGRWVAVAESGDVLTATEINTWTKLSPSADRLRGVTFAYGQFSITGDNGLVRVTIDTSDYDSRVLPDGLFVESVVYARHAFVAVGEAGYIITSPDAVTWQRVASGTAAYLRGVTFFNGQFIAVGENGTVLNSAEAAGPWTRRAVGTNALFTAASASEAAAVVVGFGGTIFRSAPVAAAPTIVTAPASALAVAGDNVLFRVTATGSPPLSYQWSFNGQPLAGQTSDQLFLSDVQSARVGAYSVTVGSARGTITSAAASLTLVASTAPGPIVDESFRPTLTISGGIAAAVEQADGKLIIGGSQFFVTPGVSPFALARLNPDGSLDPTFNTGSGFNSGGTVSHLALQPDGKILVAGSFNTFNGVGRSNLLRLNAAGSLDTSFTAATGFNTAGPTQLTIETNGRSVRVSDGRIRRLNNDGSLDTAFMGNSNGTTATLVAILRAGSILVAECGVGFDLARIRRLGIDGPIDSTFSPIRARAFSLSFGSFVDLRTLPDGRVLYSDRLIHRGIVSESTNRLTADGAADGTWPGLSVTSGSESLVSAYAGTTQGKVFQASNLVPPSNLSSPPKRTIRRFNADASPDFSFDARGGPNGNITGIVPLRDGRTIIFGEFTTFDGIARAKLGRLVATNAPAVHGPVIVSTTPEAVAVRPGETVAITVLAAGSGPLAYAAAIGSPVATAGGVTVPVPTKISGTYTVVVTVSNRVGSVSTAPVRVVVAPSAPIIASQPAAVATFIGRTAVFTVDAAGSAPFTYQWFRGRIPVGTSSSLTLANLTTADSGDYTVVVRNSLGATTSQVARLSVDGTPALANISTRATVGPAERALIAGFVIRGATAKNILVRGIGPGLATFGLSATLPNPVLKLYDGASRLVATNDNWAATATPASLFNSLGAFALASGSADAALQVSLAPGNYTAVLADSGDRTGAGLVEIYEADNNTNRIVNLSSRAFVGTDASIGIAGIVVRGQQPSRYLIRGVGPALAQFGVSGALTDPVLMLTTSLGATVAANDGWSTGTNAADIAATAIRVGAFPFANSSKDAAVLVTLQPGNYTALVSGANGTIGVALVEVYEIP